MINAELRTHPYTKWEHEELQCIMKNYQGKLLDWLDRNKNKSPTGFLQFYLGIDHNWMTHRLDTWGSIELSFLSLDSGMKKAEISRRQGFW